MKMTQELSEALNAQAAHEYKNMFAYKQIESYFEDKQLINLAEYFRKQSDHEREHGDMIVAYLHSRTGGSVKVEEIEDSSLEIIAPEQAGDLFVRLEELTTVSLEAIYGLILGEKSYVDLGFVQKMLVEQVEEEDIASQFAMQIKETKDIYVFNAVFGD